jgi:hypothetical protein
LFAIPGSVARLSIEVCKRHTEMFVGYANFYLHDDPVTTTHPEPL